MAGSNAAYAQIPHLLRSALLPILSAARQRLGVESLVLAGHLADLPSLQPGDAERARGFYAGAFAATGHVQPDLRDFSWLADLAATGLDLYRVFARKLVRATKDQGRRDEFNVIASRLLALGRHGGFLLKGADADFRSLLQGLIAADIRHLTRAKVRSADQAVMQTTAVLAATVCFGGPERLRDEAAERLAAAADAVILADGGHASRMPSKLCETLALLVPLRQLLATQRIQLPQLLIAAIERALPALRMLCHGDGGLSLLQGGASTCATLVRKLLAETATGNRPQLVAKQSGFARLSLGSATVLVDCGTGGCCDGALGFEFSDGIHRIVGPCGFPQTASAAWMAAAASRAAQSSLAIERQAGSTAHRFAAASRKSTSAAAVAAEVITAPNGQLFKGRSAPPATALELCHHREIFLSADGGDLRGEDRLTCGRLQESQWPGLAFAIRFHLHPKVSARFAAADGPLALSLPDGTGWQFSARGGNLSLEDSVFLATGGPAIKSRQIVIRGLASEARIVNWAFRRQPPVAS